MLIDPEGAPGTEKRQGDLARPHGVLCEPRPNPWLRVSLAHLEHVVRSIFRRYAELGSVRLLNQELEVRGVISRAWTSASGRRVGGKPFSRGGLYLILRNRIYLGEIVHKGQSHRGEHPPIIDQPLWEAVQAQLAGHTTQRSPGTRTHQPSLLAGLLYDRDGNRMTPTHAVKKGARSTTMSRGR